MVAKPSPRTGNAECWLIDVGQGTCNIIYLGNGHAVVIDCGGVSAAAPLEILSRYVTHIDHLVVSHSHNDHSGGAARIIAHYQKAIGNIWFPEDFDVSKKSRSKLPRLLLALEDQGKLSCDLHRLERSKDIKIIPLRDDAAIELQIWYPDFRHAIKAALGSSVERPNRSSGILAVKYGDSLLVFPGDAPVDAWEYIASARDGKLPIEVDLLAVPHHGGIVPKIDKSGGYVRTKSSSTVRDASRIIGEIVRPKHSYISVGTTNAYKHPRPEVVAALRLTNSRVMCSEITSGCCNDPNKLWPGVMLSQMPRQHTHSSVPCAGSVTVEISPKGIVIPNAKSHERGVDRLANRDDALPLCRQVVDVAISASNESSTS